MNKTTNILNTQFHNNNTATVTIHGTQYFNIGATPVAIKNGARVWRIAGDTPANKKLIDAFAGSTPSVIISDDQLSQNYFSHLNQPSVQRALYA